MSSKAIVLPFAILMFATIAVDGQSKNIIFNQVAEVLLGQPKKTLLLSCPCHPYFAADKVSQSIRQSSGSCQAVVKQLSSSCQAVVRQSSSNCQAVIKPLSGSCQAVVRQLSSNCQLSDSQNVDSNQTVVK